MVFVTVRPVHVKNKLRKTIMGSAIVNIQLQRREKTLLATIQKMVLELVSTREIQRITKKLSDDMKFLKSTVSILLKRSGSNGEGVVQETAKKTFTCHQK